MIVIQRVFIAHLLVAVAALAIGFAGLDLPFWLALLFILMGSLWYAAHVRQLDGLANLALYLFMLGAALGVLAGAPGWLMLVTAVATLAAWDLDQFYRRINLVEKIENEGQMWRLHLRRLALVEGLGLLAGLAALTASFTIPFWWTALLALAVVIGLRRVIEYVRKVTE